MRPADVRTASSCPRRPRAQPEEHQRGAAARQADRVHRAVGLGQVVAGVRHDLRGGPATLRRVAQRVRPPVPRPDGQAGRRLHRGPVAGHLHRPEVGLPEPPLDGRHDHRGLRLPAPPVGPHRPAPLPRARRAAGAPEPAADRRPPGGAAGGHPLPGPRARRAGSEGRVRDAARGPVRAGLRPGPDRRRHRRDLRVPEGRRAAGPLRAAHDRGRRRPARPARRHRAPPDRLGRDRPQAGRGRRRDRDRPPRRAGRGRAGRRDAHLQPAPRLPGRRRVLRGAGAPQLLVQLALRRLPGLRRPGHDLRGRPRARRAQPGPLDRRGCHLAVEHGPHAVLQPDARGRGRRQRHRPGQAVGEADQGPAAGAAVRHQGPGHRQVQEPLRPQPPVLDQLRGRDPVPQAPARGLGERLEPGADRDLHAGGARARPATAPASSRRRSP